MAMAGREAKKEWRMSNDENTADEPQECWCELIRLSFICRQWTDTSGSRFFSVWFLIDLGPTWFLGFTSKVKSKCLIDSYSRIELLSADEQYVISWTMMTGKKSNGTKYSNSNEPQLFCGPLLECAFEILIKFIDWMWIEHERVKQS